MSWTTLFLICDLLIIPQITVWGGPGGYVFRKAYQEFFYFGDKLYNLVAKSRDLPSLTFVAVLKKENVTQILDQVM